jgi:hypothetical protein
MPDPDRLLNTLRKAAGACRETPGRRGRFIQLEDVGEVMVVGDLHGNVDNFRRLLACADLAKNPRRHLVLQEVIHGPYRYPIGGDKSHQMVDVVAALKCQFPRQTHYMLGNHELSQWTSRQIMKADEDLNGLFREGVDSAYGVRAEEIYAAYLEFFAALPAALRTPNRVYISHSLPSAKKMDTFNPAALEKEEVTLDDCRPGGTLFALVWGRDTSTANATTFLEKVDADLLISGHIACEDGFSVPNDRQIILDALGVRAGICLFPADRPLTHPQLVNTISTI